MESATHCIECNGRMPSGVGGVYCPGCLEVLRNPIRYVFGKKK